VVLLFTGQTGKAYGYTADGFRPDGMFWYTGEGQVGDMQMTKGNLAIRRHSQQKKTLHLFEDLGRGQVQYLGEVSYVDHHTQITPDRNGKARDAIVFELALESSAQGAEPTDVTYLRKESESRLWRHSMTHLRELAIRPAPAGSDPRKKKMNVYLRSQAVRVYVLRRAGGVCEGCGQPAPFETPKGQKYLEPHHIRRLSDGGPDHPRWVAGLCPNCHRRVHYGKDGGSFNATVAERLAGIEPEA
jgi:5-methylcytosine-specific restriction protein A